LEDRLGVSLFERRANGVSVSRTGRLLAEDVNAGLARIANGVQMVTERSRETTTLVISAPPSFMQHWLLPRLNDFETQENDIEIALDADQKLTPPVWQEGSARLSMRYGRGPWRGVRTRAGISRDGTNGSVQRALQPPLHGRSASIHSTAWRWIGPLLGRE
jgi:LysR family glycine cleavage system transcriptional activator